MRVEVTKGEIILNTLVLAVDHPDVKVITGDLTSKYAEALVGGSSHHIEITLYKSERTLNIDDNAQDPTYVKIHMDSAAPWHCLVDVARYSLYIVLWRDTGIWDRELWGSDW